MYFLAQNDTTLVAVDVDLSGDVPRIGKPKELFGVHLVYSPMSPEWGAYDVAADGKRFLVDSPDQAPAEEPINMIVNWEAELKKSVSRQALLPLLLVSFQWTVDARTLSELLRLQRHSPGEHLESAWRASTRQTNAELLAIIKARFGTTPLEKLDKVEMQTWLNGLAETRSRSCVWHVRIFLRPSAPKQ
jgi:hypothetical protein